MKPFDLEKALAGEPVVTRDGRPIKIGAYNEFAKYQYQKILGWDDIGDAIAFSEQGRYLMDGSDSPYDLFMAPTERKEWVVLYTDINTKNASIARDENDAVKLKNHYNLAGYKDVSIHQITVTE